MALKNIFPNTLGCNGMDASLPSVARCQKGPLTTSVPAEPSPPIRLANMASLPCWVAVKRMHKETFPLRKSAAPYPRHWEHFYWAALLLPPLAVCLVEVCVRLALWRPGPPRVLLRVFWWEWLHYCGHPAWETAAYIPKNSSRRLKRDVYVFACTLSSRPMAP